MQTDLGHAVNLVCASKICSFCLDKKSCNNNFTWDNNDDFCTWLFSKFNRNFIAIAYNMKSYDGYFIINYIVGNYLPGEKLPEILLNGSKILLIKFSGVTIKDSINFIPMSLAKLPKTFGFKEIKKGYFPHFFNTPENQNYTGPYPSPEANGSQFMSNEEHKIFMQWYESQNNKIFNLNKEILDYCKSDVDILMKSCISFRELFIEITKTNPSDSGVDPFMQCITLPAACHYVFRRNFMKPQTIGLIPLNGYANESTSYKAIIWMKYISKTKNISIRHARNSTVKQILNFKVDGWDDSTNTVYEFHGCVFHGCPRCYSGDTYNSLKNELMSTTFSKHKARIEKIKSSNEVNSLIEIWECDYDNLIKESKSFADFYKQENEVRPQLKPRDSLSGGRTNAVILHHEGPMGYVDFTSLYPFIQKYGVFPLGHPKIITENFQDLDNYFGLIYCRILPPRDLYIPVLPFKTNNKLVFPLCSKCATENIKACLHSDAERELENTWVLLEVMQAIKLGYKVTKIFEIWHYPEKIKNDVHSKKGGLFTDYVNTFLKIKQEASGFQIGY